MKSSHVSDGHKYDLPSRPTDRVLRWLSSQFGEVVGKQLISVVDKKNEKKYKKSQKQYDSYAKTNTFFEEGSIFLKKPFDDDEDLETLKSKFSRRPSSSSVRDESVIVEQHDHHDCDHQCGVSGLQEFMQNCDDATEGSFYDPPPVSQDS
jgi:hypothetical protein